LCVMDTSPSMTSQLFPLQEHRLLSVWHFLQRLSYWLVMQVGCVFCVKHRLHCKSIC
jgi:hypothetical protein